MKSDSTQLPSRPSSVPKLGKPPKKSEPSHVPSDVPSESSSDP
jgi:hypothetical protein